MNPDEVELLPDEEGNLPTVEVPELSAEEKFTFTVPAEAAGKRLDVFLASQIPHASRVQIKRGIDAGTTLVEPDLDVRLAQRDPGWRAVHHATDRGSVAFAPARESKQVPERIAGHGRDASLVVEVRQQLR